MGGRRVWALAALLLATAASVLVVVVTVTGFPRGLPVLLCVALAALVAWYAVRRRGAARALGATAAAVLLAGAVVLIIVEGKPVLNLLVVVGLVAAGAAARAAFVVHVRLPPAAPPRGRLGIAVIGPTGRRGDGGPARAHGMQQWSSSTFEIGSDGLVRAGIDGEATVLDPPLRFRILSPEHCGYE